MNGAINNIFVFEAIYLYVLERWKLLRTPNINVVSPKKKSTKYILYMKGD